MDHAELAICNGAWQGFCRCRSLGPLCWKHHYPCERFEIWMELSKILWAQTLCNQKNLHVQLPKTLAECWKVENKWQLPCVTGASSLTWSLKVRIIGKWYLIQFAPGILVLNPFHPVAMTTVVLFWICIVPCLWLNTASHREFAPDLSFPQQSHQSLHLPWTHRKKRPYMLSHPMVSAIFFGTTWRPQN